MRSALTRPCPVGTVRARRGEGHGSRDVPTMKQMLKRLIKGGLRKLGNSAVDYDRIIGEVHRKVAAEQKRALREQEGALRELKTSLAADYERVSNHLRALQNGGVGQ